VSENHIAGREAQSPRGNSAHIPVLLDEVVAALAVAPGETHVDGTFGAGATHGLCWIKARPASSLSIATPKRLRQAKRRRLRAGGA
jgi:16S rRNA C1402 N4-methylase RsmH